MDMDDDDYFEMMHADELEMMKDGEFDSLTDDKEKQDFLYLQELANQIEPPQKIKSKRVLDFSDCSTNIVSSKENSAPRCDDVHSKKRARSFDENADLVNTNKKAKVVPEAERIFDLEDIFLGNTNKKAKAVPEVERIFDLEDIFLSTNAPRTVKKRMPDGDFISVRGYDGSIVYVGLKNERKTFRKTQPSIPHCSKLLGVSLASLRAQLAEEELVKRNVLAEQRTDEIQNETESSHELDQAADIKHLWVDKYAPQKYSDLISEEYNNRSLLKWLKLWDFSSFGIESKLHHVNHDNAAKNQNVKTFDHFHGVHLFDEADKYKRPLQKVALVSGPPGLGKTTLAHVIARHAGYNVVEMNASDERTAGIFQERIEAATQMKSVLGEQNSRPNCLVIDEIDGAPQAAIDVLLKILKKSDAPSSSKTSKRKKEIVLLRPIICICNDLYVPSLRQLRQLCFLVSFHVPLATNLAGRLMEIAKIEMIKTDVSALMALCDKAEKDIRSCINTLQFIKSKHGGELTASSVASLSLGQKDFHRSLLNVWQEIFTLPKPIKPRYVNPSDREVLPDGTYVWENVKKTASTGDRFKSILQIVSSAEEGKIQQGCFENYLLANIKDPRMKSLNHAIEWLCHVDLVNTQIMSLQDYSMMRYLPFSSILFHFLFAVNRPHKIVFPKSNFEFQTNLSTSKELLQTLIHGTSPSVRSCLSFNTCVMDIAPYLCEIIQPSLRPVNVQLFTSHEKESLNQVVRIMMAYNLLYKQERNAEGQYIYALDPNIERVTKFSDTKPSRQMNHTCKQLIAREIDLEKMRQTEKSESTLKSKTGKQIASTPNRLNQTLQPKPIKESKLIAVDFFGRRIEKTVEVPVKESSGEHAVTSNIFGQVWYKYKEGFSNAVKRSIKVKDFL